MANKYHVFKVHQTKNQNMHKNDTYSPHMDFVINLIFYFTTAFFWAITFGNPSINEETEAIWNYAPFLVIALAHSANFKSAHSINYWWIFKSNNSKESCCVLECEAYDNIHMWRISIVFLRILLFFKKENRYKIVKNENLHKRFFFRFLSCISNSVNMPNSMFLSPKL